jgi:hypothetical protein
MKFQGDIACLAHVLNLVVQDILKATIKDAYNDLNNSDINIQENININEEESEENSIIINSKLFIYFPFLLYYLYLLIMKIDKDSL